MFHPKITGDDLSPLWTGFPRKFYTPEIQHRYQKWPYSKPDSTCSFRPNHFGGPGPSLVFQGEKCSIPNFPRVGIQERFDEICEKYELRDGDAAGEVGDLGFVDGAAVSLWSLRCFVEVFCSSPNGLSHTLGWVYVIYALNEE